MPEFILVNGIPDPTVLGVPEPGVLNLIFVAAGPCAVPAALVTYVESWNEPIWTDEPNEAP